MHTRRVWLVHHFHTSKDLRKYGETAGETFTHNDGAIAAYDTKEAAEERIKAEVAKITARGKWNVRDMLTGGRGSYRSIKIGVEVVARGERHEFRTPAIDYFPEPTEVREARENETAK